MKLSHYFIISMIKVFIGTIKLFFKAIFTPIAYLLRHLFFKATDYKNDPVNSQNVKNIKCVTVLGFGTVFSLYASFKLFSVLMNGAEPMFLLAIVGVPVVFFGRDIESATVLEKKAFMGLGEPLTIVLTTLTTTVASIHIFLHFSLESWGKLALVSAMFIMILGLGWVVYRLMNDNSSIGTLEKLNARFEARKKGVDDSKLVSEIAKKDFELAINKPTQYKPKKEVITLPTVSRYQHMQIIGPTGTGKSILGLNLSVQDVMNPNHGVIALEPTKDFVHSLRAVSEKIGRKYYYIDPTDENTTVINPLDGDDHDEVAEINATAFIGYLGDNANQFYLNRQKNALKMAIKVAKHLKGNDATYLDLYEILRPANVAGREDMRKLVTDDLIRTEFYDYSEEFMNEKTYNQASQNYSGLIDYLKDLTSNEYMRRVICQKSTISLREIFNNGDVLLVTTAYGKLKSQGFVLGRLIITMLQSEVFARTEVSKAERDKLPPMAVYIDEVQNYVSEPFAELFEMARKAKLMMTIMHQGLAQLGAISQRLEETIFDNARQKAVFGGINYDDCTMFAKKIGEQFEKVKSRSSQMFNVTGISSSVSEQMRFTMTPTEIHNLHGFQTDTGQPAEVLFILNIHNRADHAIGLVAPLPFAVFENNESTEDSKAPNIVQQEVAATSVADETEIIPSEVESVEENEGDSEVVEAPKKRSRGTRGRGRGKKKENDSDVPLQEQQDETEENKIVEQAEDTPIEDDSTNEENEVEQPVKEEPKVEKPSEEIDDEFAALLDEVIMR